MNPLHIAEDIVPLGEFKTHAARVLRRVRESARPVVITQNGRPAAVLLAPEEFDRLAGRPRFTGVDQCGSADPAARDLVDAEDLASLLTKPFPTSETD